ncbi:MAG TPA: hypothetical protein PLQ36_03415 [Candidatus Gracilibacteria bacterium]|nr:hypothetical protein [Candidatus Gracilibacteria bacterium]
MQIFLKGEFPSQVAGIDGYSMLYIGDFNYPTYRECVDRAFQIIAHDYRGSLELDEELQLWCVENTEINKISNCSDEIAKYL